MTCAECGDEVDTLVKVKVDGKTVKMCEDCASQLEEQAEQAESAMQNMMEYKGRR